MPSAGRLDDPLAWWQKHEKNGLLGADISLLARYCFCIRGSSAMLERAFSHAGRAIGPKRATLSTEHAESTLFVHENILREVF